MGNAQASVEDDRPGSMWSTKVSVVSEAPPLDVEWCRLDQATQARVSRSSSVPGGAGRVPGAAQGRAQGFSGFRSAFGARDVSLPECLLFTLHQACLDS